MKFFVKHLKANRSGVLIMLIFQPALFLLRFLMVLAINAFINYSRDYTTIIGIMDLKSYLFGSQHSYDGYIDH